MIYLILWGVFSYLYGVLAHVHLLAIQAPKVNIGVRLLCAFLYPIVWSLNNFFSFLGLDSSQDTVDKMKIVEEAWPDCYKQLLREGKRKPRQ